MDQTDIAIVSELSEDGRRAFREIARKLGVSEGTVRTRVARMQEQGLVRICAVGDTGALGIACNAVVLVKVKPQSIVAAAESLAALGHVRYVGITMGSSDIAIQTLHTSFEELFRFVSETLPRMIPDLLGTETLQVARVVKSEWSWTEWFRRGLLPAATDDEASAAAAPSDEPAPPA